MEEPNEIPKDSFAKWSKGSFDKKLSISRKLVQLLRGTLPEGCGFPLTCAGTTFTSALKDRFLEDFRKVSKIKKEINTDNIDQLVEVTSNYRLKVVDLDKINIEEILERVTKLLDIIDPFKNTAEKDSYLEALETRLREGGKVLVATVGHKEKFASAACQIVLGNKLMPCTGSFIHKTTTKAFEIIKEEGISPMRRSAIHGFVENTRIGLLQKYFKERYVEQIRLNLDKFSPTLSEDSFMLFNNGATNTLFINGRMNFPAKYCDFLLIDERNAYNALPTSEFRTLTEKEDLSFLVQNAEQNYHLNIFHNPLITLNGESGDRIVCYSKNFSNIKQFYDFESQQRRNEVTDGKDGKLFRSFDSGVMELNKYYFLLLLYHEVEDKNFKVFTDNERFLSFLLHVTLLNEKEKENVLLLAHAAMEEDEALKVCFEHYSNLEDIDFHRIFLNYYGEDKKLLRFSRTQYVAGHCDRNEHRTGYSMTNDAYALLCNEIPVRIYEEGSYFKKIGFTMHIEGDEETTYSYVVDSDQICNHRIIPKKRFELTYDRLQVPGGHFACIPEDADIVVLRTGKFQWTLPIDQFNGNIKKESFKMDKPIGYTLGEQLLHNSKHNCVLEVRFLKKEISKTQINELIDSVQTAIDEFNSDLKEEDLAIFLLEDESIVHGKEIIKIISYLPHAFPLDKLKYTMSFLHIRSAAAFENSETMGVEDLDELVLESCKNNLNLKEIFDGNSPKINNYSSLNKNVFMKSFGYLAPCIEYNESRKFLIEGSSSIINMCSGFVNLRNEQRKQVDPLDFIKGQTLDPDEMFFLQRIMKDNDELYDVQYQEFNNLIKQLVEVVAVTEYDTYYSDVLALDSIVVMKNNGEITNLSGLNKKLEPYRNYDRQDAEVIVVECVIEKLVSSNNPEFVIEQRPFERRLSSIKRKFIVNRNLPESLNDSLVTLLQQGAYVMKFQPIEKIVVRNNGGYKEILENKCFLVDCDFRQYVFRSASDILEPIVNGCYYTIPDKVSFKYSDHLASLDKHEFTSESKDYAHHFSAMIIADKKMTKEEKSYSLLIINNLRLKSKVNLKNKTNYSLNNWWRIDNIIKGKHLSNCDLDFIALLVDVKISENNKGNLIISLADEDLSEAMSKSTKMDVLRNVLGSDFGKNRFISSDRVLRVAHRLFKVDGPNTFAQNFKEVSEQFSKQKKKTSSKSSGKKNSGKEPESSTKKDNKNGGEQSLNFSYNQIKKGLEEFKNSKDMPQDTSKNSRIFARKCVTLALSKGKFPNPDFSKGVGDLVQIIKQGGEEVANLKKAKNKRFFVKGSANNKGKKVPAKDFITIFEPAGSGNSNKTQKNNKTNNYPSRGYGSNNNWQQNISSNARGNHQNWNGANQSYGRNYAQMAYNGYPGQAPPNYQYPQQQQFNGYNNLDVNGNYVLQAPPHLYGNQNPSAPRASGANAKPQNNNKSNGRGRGSKQNARGRTQ